MIFANDKEVKIEGTLRDLRLELTVIMSEIRDIAKEKLTDEEIDDMLHDAVDMSGKSCEQLLDEIAKMVDELRKEL